MPTKDPEYLFSGRPPVPGSLISKPAGSAGPDAAAGAARAQGPYWPAFGPQETQYVPGPLLHACENEVVLLETGGGAGAGGNITFTTNANFYGPPAKAFGGASAEGTSLPQPSPDTPAVGRVHGGHFAAVVRSEL